MKNFYWIFACFLLVVACKQEKTTPAQAPQAGEPAVEPKIKTECFANVVGRDTTALQITIDENNVTGYLAYVPFEKDRALGSIKGALADGVITAQYTYMIEGNDQVEEILIKRDGNKVFKAVGELTEANGMLVLKNKSKPEYTEAYEKVDCKIIAGAVKMAIESDQMLKKMKAKQ